MVSTVTVNNVYRDYVINGVPGSGNHEPDKADIRALLSRLESVAGIGAVAVGTKAELDLITDKDDATPGFVWGDGTATNNGQYAWDDSGSAWVKLRALPDTVAVLQSVSGTNTITASVGTGVDPAVVSLFILVAAATNTGAVALNISGSGAQDLVDRNGDALVAGSLVSGRAYLVFDDGSDYRLLNDDDRILPFQGAYAGGTTYELGDLVESGGSIWYSLQDSNTGNTPAEGAYWTEFLPGASVADNTITNAKLSAAHSLALSHSVADRTALKALDTSRYKVSYLQESGREGVFVWDSIDLSAKVSLDTQEGLYIAPTSDATGASGAWVRVLKDTVTLEMFGAVTDWNGTTGTDASDAMNAILALDEITSIRGTGNPYYFGDVAQDAQKFSIARDIDIDWRGSLLVCEGDNTVSGTSAALFKWTDCRMNMRNFEFLDTQFDFAGPSRGVQVAQLIADAQTTYGHTLTGFHVQKAQSLLTILSNNPSTARSIGIKVCGTADDVYYGINAAGNGDNIDFDYHLDRCDRIFFVYDISGFKGNASLNSGEASSGQLIVANSGGSSPITKDVDVTVSVSSLNGPILVTDTTGGSGDGKYRNINLDISFEEIGANLTASSEIVRFGDGSLSTTEETLSMDDIRITLRPSKDLAVFSAPFRVFTPSPNYGKFELWSEGGINEYYLYPKNASGVPMGPTLYINGEFAKSIDGDLTATNNVVEIPTKYLSPRQTNSKVTCKVRVTAANNSPGVFTYAEYSVIGNLDSSGLLTVTSVDQIFKRSTGSPTPTITIAASGSADTLNISADSYTNAFALLTGSVSWV